IPGEAPAGELTLTIQGEEYNINYQGDLGSAIAALLASTRPGMEDVSVAQEFSNMALSMYVGSEDPEDPKKNSLFLRSNASRDFFVDIVGVEENSDFQAIGPFARFFANLPAASFFK